MATLKLIKENLEIEDNAASVKSIIFNPLTGISPEEIEQQSSLFLGADAESKNELSLGGEFIIFKK